MTPLRRCMTLRSKRKVIQPPSYDDALSGPRLDACFSVPASISYPRSEGISSRCSLHERYSAHGPPRDYCDQSVCLAHVSPHRSGHNPIWKCGTHSPDASGEDGSADLSASNHTTVSSAVQQPDQGWHQPVPVARCSQRPPQTSPRRGEPLRYPTIR